MPAPRSWPTSASNRDVRTCRGQGNALNCRDLARSGHEIAFLYVGRLDPLPALSDASLTETDGSLVPLVWRSVRDEQETLPLYPSGAVAWVHSLAERRAR
jgi:hypothetical protein